MTEEQHDPWLKRLLIGFARTSENIGPRKPGGPHQLIQEIDSELPVAKPALQLTYQIFGSCPPMQSFDPAKLLTVRMFLLSSIYIMRDHAKVTLSLSTYIYICIFFFHFFSRSSSTSARRLSCYVTLHLVFTYFLCRTLGSFKLLIYY